MLPNYTTTYSIERLSQEYNETDLQPKKAELITDKEVSIFLNEKHIFWRFYGIALFVLIFILAGVFSR